MKYSLALALFALVFLSGCAGREYFANENATPLKELSSLAITINSNTAPHTLKQGEFLDQNGHKIAHEKATALLFENKDFYTFAIPTGFVLVAKHSQEMISFQSSIVLSVYIYDGKVAILTRGNEFLLYQINEQTLLFSHKEKNPNIISTETAQIQANETHLFVPFLNAKIALFDKQKQKINENFTITEGELASNIISLATHKTKLIGHTREKLFVIRNGQLISKPLPIIKDIALTDDYILVASHIGDIISLNYNLVVQKKISFKYAEFTHLLPTDSTLFATTRNGYLVQLNSHLEQQNIYFAPSLKSTKIFTQNNTIYFGNYHIDLNTLAANSTQK